jgi:SAM-dependent methyltransferase
MTNQPWFAEESGFYGPDYLLEYDEILSQARTTNEVNFVTKALGLQLGDSLLDVPCGHGRHLVELALRGYSVTGAELNSFFLNKAQEAADSDNVSVQLVHQDMRELVFDNEFNAAINLFTSMGFFERDEDDVAFLSGVYKALKSEGLFLLDFVNRNWLTKNMKQKDWRKLPDGTILLVEREYDDVFGRKLDHRIKIKDGIVGKRETISQRIYSTNELVSMANSVGFELINTYGSFQDEPLTLNSRRTILVFKK